MKMSVLPVLFKFATANYMQCMLDDHDGMHDDEHK